MELAAGDENLPPVIMECVPFIAQAVRVATKRDFGLEGESTGPSRGKKPSPLRAGQ